VKRTVRSIAIVSILIVSFPISLLSQPELTLVDEWQVGKKLSAALFSPDGKDIATADSVIKIYHNDIKWISYKLLNTPVPSKILKIAYSSDGKYLTGGSIDGNIFIWDASKFNSSGPSGSNSFQKLSGHAGEITSLIFSPDGRYLATGGSDSTIFIWDASNWKSIKKITGHRGVITDLIFHPDGTYLVSASSLEKYVRIWDVITWKEKTKLFNEDKDYEEYDLKDFRNFSFSPDGSYLACVTYNGYSDIISIWNMNWMGSIKSIDPIFISTLSDLRFSPDGGYLFLAGSNNVIAIFNTSNWEEVDAIQVKYDSPIRSISFTPDGNIISFVNGDEIFICSIDPPMTPQNEETPKPQPKRR
jgi:WD40 repeat protein